VREVWLYEPEEARLWRIIAGRGRGFEHQSPDVQRNQVQLAWLYGQWLKQEAERYSVPVLAARPWDDVVARVLAMDATSYE
jgi:hypothetical protein